MSKLKGNLDNVLLEQCSSRTMFKEKGDPDNVENFLCICVCNGGGANRQYPPRQ